MVGVVAIVSFLLLIAIEIPIALGITASGLLAVYLMSGTEPSRSTMAAVPYSATAKYALVVIPMYILLGALISHAGIGQSIFSAVNRVVKRLPGGLAATTVGATSIFSGISGSSAADVATFGRVAVSEMGRNGYDRAYAAAVVAAAGAFAALIPPSVTIVLYAIIAEQSVSALILAGVVPGVLSGVILMSFVIFNGWRAESAKEAPKSSRHGEARRPSGGVSVAAIGGEKSSVGRDVTALFYAAILFAVVVGGLYTGVFTAAESGAIGAFVALVIAVVSRRKGEISLPRLIWRASRETADVTSMIFLLLIGGAVFSYALALSGLPREVAEWAGGLDVPPKAVIGIMLLLLLPLGAFLDGLSILLLTVPIISSVGMELGFDGIWIGIMVLKIVEIGLITPPVGVNAFIMSSITGQPVERVFRALVPFVLLDLTFTAVVFVFPDIALWLPKAAGVM